MVSARWHRCRWELAVPPALCAGKLGIEALILVGIITHSYFSVFFVFASEFLHPSAKHLEVSKLQARPTHSRLYILDGPVTMPQVSCRLDGRSLGDRLLLPVAADGSEE